MKTLIHSTFGRGLVISESNNTITIDFGGEVKTLIISFAHLKNEDGSDYGIQFIEKPKKSKKLNKANFETNEEKANNPYYKMSDSEFYEMRRRDAINSRPSSMR